ncbi:hypothetical protein VP01_3342g2 [Puccinia sorghi]|uniref:21S rRNA pseudouridine(2819) synthase n=1 Tax=Puccinia sorghi TaxID=27349 RepID=A0A0L6UX20_9BASI|nr:hypothetical protein VP01_3342g2 [Puccinia sorghi]
MSARRLLSTISSSLSRRTGPSLRSRTSSHPVLAPTTKDQQQKTTARTTRAKNTSEEELAEQERTQRLEELTAKLEQSFKPPTILFENEKVVVVDKPAGAALQADPGSEPYIRWKFIMDYLEKRRGKLFIVHRLDKSTTGPLILSKSSTASRTLSTQFKNATVTKTYYAAIQFLGDRIGPIQDAKAAGLIECRIRDRNDRMVIAESNRTGPDSGPIVGDFKYDFRYLSPQSRKAIHHFLNQEAPGRLLLHCSEIQFKLYRKEQPREYTVRVKSPIPDDFRIVCDQLDLSTSAIP